MPAKNGERDERDQILVGFGQRWLAGLWWHFTEAMDRCCELGAEHRLVEQERLFSGSCEVEIGSNTGLVQISFRWFRVTVSWQPRSGQMVCKEIQGSWP